MKKLLHKIFGTHHEREVRKVLPLVEKINAIESKFKYLSDEELKELTPRFKMRLSKG
jgi:preprotein translocase subunit SecA